MKQAQKLTYEDMMNMEKRYRVQFVNSLPGFKSLNLIASQDEEGMTNLAIFSSVIHLGSNPPLLGFICRPDSVPRHTLENIRSTRFFSLNHINGSFYRQAHQTSARYDRNISEFEACGLEEEQYDDFPVPFVKEARIQVGCELEEEQRIRANDTHLVIGRVCVVYLKDVSLSVDGHLDLEEAGTLCLSGSDSYHQTSRLQRLPYAKAGNHPDKRLK